MKLYFHLLLVASSRAAVDVRTGGTPPPVKVVKEFLSQDEIQHFLTAEVDGHTGATTFYGSSIMPPGILSRLPREQNDLDEHCSFGDLAEAPAAAIMTKMMTNTTHLHKDMLTGMGGVIGCDPPLPTDKAINDDVGIIFLNTNARAFFNREDTQVPAVAGTLVAFNGGFDHNTIVENGSVRIAGPFHLKTLQYVYSPASACGSICDPANNNADGTNSDCVDYDCDITSGCTSCVQTNIDSPAARNLEASNKASNKLNNMKKDAERRLRKGSFEKDVAKDHRALGDVECVDSGNRFRCVNLDALKGEICDVVGDDSSSSSSSSSD